ncbi:hypothetical protein [Citrobacter freundii]|uniref:hypothetical protein n=1 Tax=Citrobacter freundii TaxID=546 RepID=UPI0019044922|nr:hypothetical protein [Citrobacter freundii]MBJ8931578.1 hypothetical protein [Citrobacter freundii]
MCKAKIRESLQQLINNSISQDFDEHGNGSPEGLIGLMSKAGKVSLSDIPAAFECLSLLGHYLTKNANLIETTNDSTNSLIDCGDYNVVFRSDFTALTLQIRIDAGDLPYIAHWCSDSLKSETVMNMSGIYVMPFYTESINGKLFLFPDWCQAFYVRGKPGHCIPMLALKSIETLNPFENGDFANTALYRLSHYGLPVEEALSELEKNRTNTNGA